MVGLIYMLFSHDILEDTLYFSAYRYERHILHIYCFISLPADVQRESRRAVHHRSQPGSRSLSCSYHWSAASESPERSIWYQRQRFLNLTRVDLYGQLSWAGWEWVSPCCSMISALTLTLSFLLSVATVPLPMFLIFFSMSFVCISKRSTYSLNWFTLIS